MLLQHSNYLATFFFNLVKINNKILIEKYLEYFLFLVSKQTSNI